MMQAYLGWADHSGLRVLQPETDLTQRRFIQNLSDDHDRVAVWIVADSTVLQVLDFLLNSADYREAWTYLQSHSAYFGRLI